MATQALALPKRTDILIVGGGPTGLAAALALRKHGCTDLLIVDDRDASEGTSRAMVIHAATLDALDEIECAEALVSLGIKATGGKIWDGYRFHGLPDFSVLAPYTKHPFLLLLPQNLTERVLGKRVEEENISIFRPLKVVDVKPNAGNADYSDVELEDGQVVTARYVIGADGTHSVVRDAAGISYKDPDVKNGAKGGVHKVVVADVTFGTPMPLGRTEPLFVLAHANIFLALPLPSAAYEGEEVWRIVIGIPDGDPPHSPDTEYLQGLLDAYGPGSLPAAAFNASKPPKIAKTVWSSRFRTDSAVATTPFTRLNSGEGGVIVIIGDAAHKHPPAGGQGMNLGLRDAVTLGPVLVAHLRASVQPSPPERATLDVPLKAWGAVRHKHALAVVRMVKGIMSTALYKDEIQWYYGVVPINWVSVRNFILWLGNVTGMARRAGPWKMSGLSNP